MNLRNIFRKHLNEALDEIQIPSDRDLHKCPVCYPRVHTNNLEGIANNGFGREWYTCQAYGDGIYAALTFKEALNGVSSSYGHTIVEARIAGCTWKDFVIFVPSLQEQFFGRRISIEEQLRNRVREGKAQYDETFIQKHKYDHTASDSFQEGIKGSFVGSIYDWGSANVMLTCSYESAIPVRYTTDRDYNGVQWQNLLTPERREHLESMTDANWWLKPLKFTPKKNDKGVFVQTLNSNFVVAYHGDSWNAKWNIFKIPKSFNEKAVPVFPFNLDEQPTSMSPSGLFQFEYKGRVFKGRVANINNPDPAYDNPSDYSPAFYYEDKEDPENDGWYSFADIDDAFDEEESSSEESMVGEALHRFLTEGFEGGEYTVRSMGDITNPRNVFLYRRAKPEQLDSIFQNGNLRQFAGSNDGIWCGNGVYCVRHLETAINSDASSYGRAIVKSVLLGGYDRFLIFNDRLAQSIYGDHHEIKDQLQVLGANEIWEQMLYYVRKYNDYGDAANHMHGRTVGLLHHMFRRYISYEEARELSRINNSDVKPGGYRDAKPEYFQKLFAKYNIRGCVYEGGKDRDAAVVYVYDQIQPLEYSLDNGRTFSRDKFNLNALMQRMERNNDPRQKLGHLYKYIQDPPSVINANGGTLLFSSVQKDNGKWNFVNTKTREELSPVDFDESPTNMGGNSIFQFEYRGQIFKGRAIDENGDFSPAFYYIDNEDPENNGWYSFEDIDDAFDDGGEGEDSMDTSMIGESLHKHLRKL